MKIVFIDRNPEAVKTWKRWSDYEAHCGDYFDVETECVVSPANSFGFMDGNLDYRISEKLGWHVQERLQSIIKHAYNGELLVGQALLIRTDHETWPFVISAPTMRVPMNIDEMNVYLAARAAIRVAKTNGIKSLTMPGMGMGAGGLRAIDAVPYMLAGIRDGLEAPPFPKSWQEAQRRHYNIT
ncbi:tail assembly-like protein [Rhizobium phage vB_RglS_P106B]|uniref:Tail assembly-like protein n=1 Tax=Rhizobium phage vB_RglS_P106B TaxID=1458697 RepID=W6E8J3_9CAUD|nr:tail assembly-like protein [Rhizobium phage vB_RglS_P106B]AHJ10760.1 tail assembly-like protein [Rhizobium phage vB_RglS_P106B]